MTARRSSAYAPSGITVPSYLDTMVTVAASGITRVFPDLSDDLLLNLFYKGARAQWTSRDLDWSNETRLTDRQRLTLARPLTPAYFADQPAMDGAGPILPIVMAAGDTPAHLSLT